MSESLCPLSRPVLSRGLGYKPNKPDVRDVPFEMMGLSNISTVLSEPISLTQWEPPIFDQRTTNTCVAQVAAAQLAVVENQAFGVCPPYSRLGIYTPSRLEHAPFRWAPLFDNGTYPRSAYKAISKNGVPREVAWPFDLKLKNKRLPIDVRMEAYGGKGAQYSFMFSSGDALVGECIQALRSGYPPGFGSKITRRFAESPNPVEGPPQPGERFAGNHYMMIVGVRIGSNGRVQFKIRNSYSRFWGVGGYVWVDCDFITSPYSRDFSVLYGWNRIRNARPNIIL